MTKMYPKIKDAETLAKKFKLTGVIILFYDNKSRTFGLTSYGDSKENCSLFGNIGDKLHKLFCGILQRHFG